MRFGKFLLIGLAAIVVILAAGVVILLNLDFNEFKEQIAAEAKKATGRELKIAGDLKLNLFTLSPGLAVDNVRFANASWGSRPDMARFDRFEVKVGVVPLFSGKVEVKRLVLSGADILIERDKTGRGNYEFTAAAKPGEKAKSAKKPEAKKPTDAPASKGLPAVEIQEVTIERARLAYHDAASGQKLALGVKQMRLRGGTDDPLEIQVAGDFNKEAFLVKGRLGPISQLLEPVKPWPVSVEAEAGGATVMLKGTVAEPLGAALLNVDFSVAGNDLSKLSGFAGAPVPALGPYALSGKLKGRPDTSVSVNNLVVKMGKSMVGGSANIALKGRPAVTATLKSDLLDLADFVKPKDAGAKKAGAGKKGGGSAAKGGKSADRLFPADPLPLDGLRAANASLDLTVKKLLAKGVTLNDLQTKLRLRDGDLALSPLKVGVAKGTIDSQVMLNAKQATPILALKVSGKKIDIGKLLTELGITDAVFGTVNTELDVKGSGNSVRKLMAGLNGKTSIIMGKGRMRSDALDGFFGGAGKLVTQLLFSKNSKFTVVNCFVNQFDVKNGVAESRATVFDTEHARILGKGNINLGSERIAFDLDPKPRSSKLEAAAVPLEIRGTLAKPSFAPNKLAVATKLSGLFGAKIFPPGTVAGLGEAGVSKDNPCLAEPGGTAPTTRKQPAPTPSLPDLKKGAGDIGKELEKGLKDLFGR